MSTAHTTARRRELAVLAALTLAYLALPWRAMGPVTAWLGPPVVFAYLVVLPGLAVARILGVRPRDPLEAGAWVPLLGYAAALLACFLWALWRLPLDVVRFGYPAVVVALVLATPPRDTHRPPLDCDRIGTGERRAMAILAAFLVVVAVTVWIAGPPTHIQADTIDHAAYVNEVARTGQAFPHTAFYKDPGANGADLRKGLLHALMGVFERHLGASAIAIFAFLAGAQLVILSLAVYAATRRMAGGSRAVAIASGALFVLCVDGGVGSKVVRMGFYPNHFGLAPLVMFIAAATGYLVRPSRRALVLCGVFAFTAAAVHVQFVVFTAAAAAVMVVWKACSPCERWGEHLRRALSASLVGGAAILPYVVYRVATGYQTNPLHTEVQGAMFVGGGLFVVDPVRVADWMGWLGLGAFAGAVALWRHRRGASVVGYPIAALLTVLLVILNPLVLPVAFRALSYVVTRLGMIAPTYMTGGVLLAGALGLDRRFAGGGQRWWRRVAVVLTAVAVLSGAARVVENRHVITGNSAAEARVSLQRWEHDIRAVTAGLPDGSVIASDPVTSYFVSAVTPYYVLCTLDQHAPPNDRLAGARMAAARDIFSPYTSPVEKTRVMAEWGVDYVLVNEDIPRGLVLNYWTLGPDLARRARRTFRDLDGAFVRVATSGSLTLFRRTHLRVRQVGTEVPVVHAAPAGARRIDKPSGEATLVAARLGATQVGRGDRLHVDLYWSRHAPAPAGTYVVALRFDHTGHLAPFGKVGRKIKERLDGVLYRYRTNHIIQRGFYGPDAWPSDAVVIDSTTVRIPTTLAPGEYSVQARLMREAPAPNTDLGSYFFDRDIYSGVEIGRLEIE